MEHWPKCLFWNFFVQVDDHFYRPFVQLRFWHLHGLCIAFYWHCVCVSYIFVVKCNFNDDFDVKHVHACGMCLCARESKGSWYLHSWGAWAINSYVQTHFGNEIAHLGLLLCPANDFFALSISGNRLGVGNQWETWTSQPRLLMLPASLGWGDAHLSACVQVSLH